MRSFLLPLSLVLLLANACGSASSEPTRDTSPSESSAHAAPAPAPPGASTPAPASESEESSSPPPIPDPGPMTGGVWYGINGSPVPQPDAPMPGIVVGCPANGLAEARVFTLDFDGTKTFYAVVDVSVSETDGRVVLDAPGKVHVEIDTSKSFTVAPFEYAAKVTAAAGVGVSKHVFHARTFNPDWPDFDGVGPYADKAVACKK